MGKKFNLLYLLKKIFFNELSYIYIYIYYIQSISKIEKKLKNNSRC